MRILRWVLILVVVALVLLAGTAGILYLTFDPDDHRDDIVRLVEERTGRSLRLDGPMSLSFFPWLGVRLAKVTLENPPGFGDGPFATIDKLDLRVKLVPLLDGHLLVDTLEIDGLALALHRRADGLTNWSDPARSPSGEDSQAGAAAAPADDAWLKHYAVRGIRLNNGAVTWRDDAAGSRYRVDNLELSTGSIAPGSSVPLEGGLRLQSEGEGVAAELDLSGTLGLSEDMAAVEVPDLRVAVALTGASLPPAGLDGDLSTSLAYDAASGALTLADVVLKGPGGIELDGRIDGMVKAPFGIEGTLRIKPFSPREALESMEIDVPATSDPVVLGNAEGSIGVKASAEQLVLSPVRIGFDNSRVEGNIRVSLAGSPAVAFGLDVDRIDLDRYLPPADSASAPQAGRGGGQQAGPGEEQSTDDGTGPGALAAVTTRGTVAIGTLKLGGVTMTNSRIGISTGKGALKLEPMSARLYGGEYRGSLSMTASGSDVRWHAIEQLKGVQMGPLLRDLAGEDRLEGTGRLEADLEGRGISEAAVRRSARGKVSFDFRDGALKGINFAQVMRELEARLKGQRVQQAGPLQTDFSSLTGTLDVGDGKVRNDDLVMKSPFIRVTGKGDANLVAETLDYRLTAKVVGSAVGQGGKELAELEGIPLGVRVQGTFSDPRYKPDFETALKALAKKELEGHQEKLEDKVEDEIRKAFRRLF